MRWEVGWGTTLVGTYEPVRRRHLEGFQQVPSLRFDASVVFRGLGHGESGGAWECTKANLSQRERVLEERTQKSALGTRRGCREARRGGAATWGFTPALLAAKALRLSALHSACVSFFAGVQETARSK